MFIIIIELVIHGFIDQLMMVGYLSGNLSGHPFQRFSLGVFSISRISELYIFSLFDFKEMSSLKISRPTQRGYRTTSVGCRGGSRYVEG